MTINGTSLPSLPRVAGLALATCVLIAAGDLGCATRASTALDAESRADALREDGSESPPIDAEADSSRADAAIWPCKIVECQPGVVRACGDCVDNDGDNQIDADDPECLGPCHGSEESYFNPPTVGDDGWMLCKEDCYFDYPYSGSGNDGCLYDRRCDAHQAAPEYSPRGPNCAAPEPGSPAAALCAADSTQPSQCLAVCGPVTPNGCDCFGCCVVPGSSTPVYLASRTEVGVGTCDAKSLTDPTKCHPCTIVTSCFNPCDACEVCIGKPHAPAGCAATQACPGSPSQPCGAAVSQPCPSGSYCITGCCAKVAP